MVRFDLTLATGSAFARIRNTRCVQFLELARCRAYPTLAQVRKPAPPAPGGVTALGLLVLAGLVVQNTSVILCTRYTVLPGRAPYNPRAAVMMQEAIKLLACCCLTALEPEGLQDQVRAGLR